LIYLGANNVYLVFLGQNIKKIDFSDPKTPTLIFQLFFCGQNLDFSDNEFSGLTWID